MSDESSPQSASPRDLVLSNYDLILSIFFSLAQADYQLKRKFLLDLATVCKAFKEPALDILWEELPSYMPIIKLLPDLHRLENTYFFSGNFTNSSASNYAKRVRRLHFPLGSGGPEPSPHLVSRLGGQLRGAPLLPGLVQLTIADLDIQASSLLPLLLHPSLRRLELSDSALAKPHVLIVVLPSLALDVAGLKHLRLCQNNPGLKLPLPAIERIPHFPTIESLEITSPATTVPPELLRKIVSHPSLKKIGLHVTFQQITAVPATRNANVWLFPRIDANIRNLGSIDLTLQRDLGFPPDFLAQKVTSLTVLVSGGIFGSPTSLWFPTLSAYQSVRTIHIAPAPGHPTVCLPFASLTSVLSIPTVEEVVVDTEYLSLQPIHQGDAVVGQIVDAITRAQAPDFGGGTNKRKRALRTLVLPAQSPYAFPPSLESLSQMSTHAMELQRLALAIDSSLVSFKEATKIPISSNHQSSLLHLEISDLRPPTSEWSLIEHSHIAHYLDKIFPNLKTIKVYRDRSGVARQEEHWAFIEHLRKEKKVLRLYQEGKL